MYLVPRLEPQHCITPMLTLHTNTHTLTDIPFHIDLKSTLTLRHIQMAYCLFPPHSSAFKGESLKRHANSATTLQRGFQKDFGTILPMKHLL